MIYPQENETRACRRIGGIWEFIADHEDKGEEEAWFRRSTADLEKDGKQLYRLAVPASWNEQREELFKFFGKGWYFRTFQMSREWQEKSLFLRVGAAHYRSKVWLNGQYLGEYEGGSLPFEFEMSKEAYFGQENRLVILVDGSLDPWGLPPALLAEGEERVGFLNQDPPVTYDFFPYAGIHRSVWICSKSALAIRSITINTLSIDGGPEKGRKSKARLSVLVQIDSAGNSKGIEDLSLSLKVEEASLSLDLTSGEPGSFSGEIEIENPRLWDIGRGELYTAQLKLLRKGALIDRVDQTFGIRMVSMDSRGLLLNGRRIFLKGFGKHEDSDFYGRGFNPAQMSKDFALLKWVGANSFRTSHYPYAEEILEYADREGVLVIGETPFVGLNERMYRNEIEKKALSMIGVMIERDRNHPSIIAWSLANEPIVSSDRGEAFFKAMADKARNDDSTRPICYVSHLEPEENRGIPWYDFICLNKYYGWYIDHGSIDRTLSDFEACLDRFYKAFTKPMMVSEFGADAVPGMHSWPSQPFSEEFQAEMIEKQYLLMKEKEYIFGAHVWNFADFKTSQSITRIIHNRKGVFTRDRTPKLAAHRLKTLWQD